MQRAKQSRPNQHDDAETKTATKTETFIEHGKYSRRRAVLRVCRSILEPQLWM